MHEPDLCLCLSLCRSNFCVFLDMQLNFSYKKHKTRSPFLSNIKFPFFKMLPYQHLPTIETTGECTLINHKVPNYSKWWQESRYCLVGQVLPIASCQPHSFLVLNRTIYTICFLVTESFSCVEQSDTHYLGNHLIHCRFGITLSPYF